jgi:hypothetical protein
MRGRKGGRQVMVCANCLCACCWHGEMMCWEAQDADTIMMPVSELRKLNREHSENFSVKKIVEVHGQDFPRIGDEPCR